MNRLTKRIVVSFFKIDATDDFFRGFVSSFVASKVGTDGARIFNLREKKHLIKTSDELEFTQLPTFPITVVRERNTWQAKATSSGKISGISLNQGIIGDPYFFAVVPEKKMIFGFTTGPSGSLKSVARTVLEQFNEDRSRSIKLDFIPRENETPTLATLPDSGEVHLKIDSASLSEVSEDAPKLIRNIGSDTLLAHNVQLILNVPFSDSENSIMSKTDVVELVNYFADHEGCLALNVRGEDEGNKIKLEFGNTFFNFKTTLAIRNKFVDENSSTEVLEAAVAEYQKEFN